jgi:predicted RNA methylase
VAEKFDPEHAGKLENPQRLVELPPARLMEVLRLSGAETVVDFGAGTGMYAPGSIGLYHDVIVAQQPRP